MTQHCFNSRGARLIARYLLYGYSMCRLQSCASHVIMEMRFQICTNLEREVSVKVSLLLHRNAGSFSKTIRFSTKPSSLLCCSMLVCMGGSMRRIAAESMTRSLSYALRCLLQGYAFAIIPSSRHVIMHLSH
jgi:hypothetical protein